MISKHRSLSHKRTWLLMLVIAMFTISVSSLSAQTPDQINGALNAAYAKYKDLKEGKNADYIPALAKVDPNLFGIVLVTVDGKVYSVGDIKTEVSIQSISKVFTMAQVIQEQGLDSVCKTNRCGRYWRAFQLDHRN